MRLVWLLCATLALGLGGCAKFPDNPIGAGGKRLVFKLTVQGKLRTGQGAGQTGLPYVYIIALNLSNDDNPTTMQRTLFCGIRWHHPNTKFLSFAIPHSPSGSKLEFQ